MNRLAVVNAARPVLPGKATIHWSRCRAITPGAAKRSESASATMAASQQPRRVIRSMDLRLTDRVVLVTGASKGIGLACAEAFAAAGAQVAIVSRSRENLDAALAAIRSAQSQRRSRSPPTCAMRAPRARSEAARSRARAHRRPRQFRRRREALRARRARRAGLARRDGRQVLQLRLSHGHRRQAHGGTRARRDRQHHRHGRQGGEHRRTSPGGAANSALMLATVGLATAYGPQGVRVNGSIRAPRSPIACRKASSRVEDDRQARRSCSSAAQARIPFGRWARRRRSPRSRCSSRPMRRAT